MGKIIIARTSRSTESSRIRLVTRASSPTSPSGTRSYRYAGARALGGGWPWVDG
jgi:hypothetical protein